jgi:hypothetical protein
MVVYWFSCLMFAHVIYQINLFVIWVEPLFRDRLFEFSSKRINICCLPVLSSNYCLTWLCFGCRVTLDVCTVVVVCMVTIRRRLWFDDDRLRRTTQKTSKITVHLYANVQPVFFWLLYNFFSSNFLCLWCRSLITLYHSMLKANANLIFKIEFLTCLNFRTEYCS